MARTPGSRGRRALALAALLSWSLPLLAAPPPVGAEARPVEYHAPVTAPVVDPFRPPPRPWLPGNRGVDHATAPGTPVTVAAPGTVTFAGPVAGARHVTVRHDDGLRTSYSFLASIEVVAGQRLEAGEVLGTTGAILHWGVRDPTGRYLDPLSLLGTPGAAVLVPGGDDGAVRGGRSPLGALAEVVVDGLARHGAEALAWPTVPPGVALPADGAALAAWYDQVGEIGPAPHLARVLVGLHQRVGRDCSPDGVVVPGSGEPRVAVLVGGFGSTSDHAGIDGLDTGALGYGPGDVVRFSYRGGRTPPRPGEAGPLAALHATGYDADDSQGDLGSAADELVALLEAVARARPGVPVDVLAHSQGGLVARLALDEADRTGRLPAAVDLVATLGTPHRGADLATAAAGMAGDPEGARVLALAHRVGLPADPGRPALGQLAETSPEVRSVAHRRPPEGVRAVSIAARGDLTVPAPRTALVEGTEVTLPLVGPSAHDALPSHPAAAREVALARAGLPPGCESVADVLGDLVVGEGVAWSQDLVGAALGAGARAVGPPVPR